MNLSRDINIKPSFLRELHALPSQMGEQVWEKINFLAQNPIPDGHLKKKLNKWDDVYRLRVGDFRLFYSFGGNWIRLLSIRSRKNAYQKGINYEEPAELGIDAEIDSDEEVAAGYEQPRLNIHHDITYNRLPKSITSEWLAQLRIPSEYHIGLESCNSEDDLLTLNIPDEYIERIVDNLFPRPVEEIMQQPDLIVFDTNDLIRYKEGDLLGFLLRLDADQERLVDWALQGPALIKGGPGTGKSTIALYRVRSLLDYYGKQGKSNSKILFTTYTPALARFSEQLLEQLLRTRISSVTIETADEIALNIVRTAGKSLEVADQNQKKIMMEHSVKSLGNDELLSRYRIDYLLDEIEWVIEGRDIKTLETYLNVSRVGRGTALTKSTKALIWGVYQKYCSLLKERNLTTISATRCQALELVISGVWKDRYDAVIIDEAQDLTPTGLSLLVELSKSNKGIYLTADGSQSIYYKGFSWSEVHDKLQFRGRAINLRRNYRTTREISDAASHFLKSTGSGDQDLSMLRSSQSGPQPLLFGYNSENEQYDLIVKFIKQMSKHFRLKTSSAAILVPSSAVGREISEGITKVGLPCKYIRGSQLDLQSDEVKVLTMSASKGLEFPIVCVAGIDKDFPRILDKMDEDDIAETVKVSRRTLYVGITRAMRGLMVVYDNKAPSSFIKELDVSYWSTEISTN
ncbi:3'-5' exonuclease [Paenibacillus sacheonensis]|uniref:DNA 3'-5' helicase n=1 Tax=Paenibacillus sacheonensis TaxID=742054 RepID=A0A7X5C4Z6_9BACL|nr:3'-5' exonuclease [Paenibacillus sacheonensis]MBM7568082.1 superfamily I DNA/RNA helicase/mRNA-degrading endonuclease RelE of RelBE toxin-antitoxin system [Paenibacillus sacheonensis]NBC72889.1 UvrD-helicase domain-containing protein [Paenibacillus sacheonensis]